jgi:hypothetical protein
MSDTLRDVLLGNNPTFRESGRQKRARRTYDIVEWDYGFSSWALACNHARIGIGTVGWIHRADKSWGHIAGLIVFNSSTSQKVSEKGGLVHYRSGWLWRLPREWWIDDAMIKGAGWSTRAPFGGTVRRFRNGEALRNADANIAWKLLHPVAQEWIESTVWYVEDPPVRPYGSERPAIARVVEPWARTLFVRGTSSHLRKSSCDSGVSRQTPPGSIMTRPPESSGSKASMSSSIMREAVLAHPKTLATF